jgi:acetyl esterase/lipase
VPRCGLLSISAIMGADSARLYVSGHSAGGHLTASTMMLPAVRGGLAISGLYDLERIRLNYLNEKLGLDKAEAERNSPLLHIPPMAGELVVAYGTRELPELCRQSIDYVQAWVERDLPGHLLPVDGANHFTTRYARQSARRAVTGVSRHARRLGQACRASGCSGSARAVRCPAGPGSRTQPNRAITAARRKSSRWHAQPLTVQTREGLLAGELADLAEIHQTHLNGVKRDKRRASSIAGAPAPIWRKPCRSDISPSASDQQLIPNG